MNRESLLSIVAVLGLALPASAQQAAGGSGHALDANQQVGSGGVNQAAPQVDYQLRNDLVTGNVSGGQGFRGDVGYTAPGEFRGGLGSDTVFDFRARSLPPATGGYNNYGGTGGASVYREYTIPTQAPLISGGNNRPAYYEAGSRLVLPDDARGTTYFRSALEGTPVNSLGTPAPVRGYDQQPGFADSPILGVRQFGRAFDVTESAQPQQRDEDNIPDSTEEMLEADKDAALYRDTRKEPALPQMPATGFEIMQPGTLDDATTPEGAGDNLIETSNLTLGLGKRLDPNRAASPGDTQYARSLQSTIFKPNTGIAAGQSIYNDLLTDVSAGNNTTMPTDSMSMFNLPEPDDEAVREAEAEALAAVREAYSVKRPDAEDEEAEESETDPELQKLMDRLNYDRPALTTMAGQAESRSNELIRQAEAAMGNDDYMKAVSLYKQALIYAPQDPMGRVGMAHAQLGAGSFHSAALTLRRLFAQHPELIAARYEARLLPSEERLRTIQGELNKLADTAEGTDPGFVMAYLGYQINSRQLVRYGLALTQSRDPRDPLLPVLREIWLDQKQGAADDDATPAPEK